MTTVSSKFLVWPLVVYLPTSALTVGLLATIMRLGIPLSGADGFLDVFFAYALRFPGDFNIVRWMAPALGLAVLVLLSVAIRSVRPIITMASIRILLLTLIALFTILVKIFSVIVPLIPSGPGSYSSFGTAAPLTAYLFLFMDVDLCLVFLATFLPAYRMRDRKKRAVMINVPNKSRRASGRVLILLLGLTVLASAQVQLYKPPETDEIAAATHIADAAARLRELLRIKAAYTNSRAALRIEMYILDANVELADTLDRVLALQKGWLDKNLRHGGHPRLQGRRYSGRSRGFRGQA